MRPVAWLAFLVLLIPGAAAQALLVRVVPDLPGSVPGDEAVVVGAQADVDLTGWSLSDGEGEWPIPALRLAAGSTAAYVGDVGAWTSHGEAEPAACWCGASAGPRLANDGDEVLLLRPDGSVADAFAWGSGSHPAAGGSITYDSPGLVYHRLGPVGAWVDTGSADDWRTPREHRVGESGLGSPTFVADRLTLYASPDSSFETLAATIASAQQRLVLHVYELRSPALVDLLVAQRVANPSLDLQVLVEDRPVGQSADERHETAWALRRITDAGGQAWIGGSGRYAFYHLKVLVADDRVAVQSENWVPSGVPEDPSWGNRGWGVVVHDDEAADWFSSWMEGDRAAWDTTAFVLGDYDPEYRVPSRSAPRSGEYLPVEALELEGPIFVRPLISPDHTQDPAQDPVAALVHAATASVLAQQLDLATGAANDLGWSSPDPLFASLGAAANRGVSVQVQAAQPFSATDDGNTEAMARLADSGAMTDAFDRPGLATLHNKGLVVDAMHVVVGSMNGNHHSRSQNREAALLIESPQAAQYFASLFAADWDGPVLVPAPGSPGSPGPAEPSSPGTVMPAAPWPTLFGLLGVGLAIRRRP